MNVSVFANAVGNAKVQHVTTEGNRFVRSWVSMPQMERWIKQLPTTNGAWHVQESRILQHP
jgi:hypothetical protein